MWQEEAVGDVEGEVGVGEEFVGANGEGEEERAGAVGGGGVEVGAGELGEVGEGEVASVDGEGSEEERLEAEPGCVA